MVCPLTMLPTCMYNAKISKKYINKQKPHNDPKECLISNYPKDKIIIILYPIKKVTKNFEFISIPFTMVYVVNKFFKLPPVDLQYQ